MVIAVHWNIQNVKEHIASFAAIKHAHFLNNNIEQDKLHILDVFATYFN